MNLLLALFMLIALVPGITLHEYAHAWAADRLGDQTPRRFGRLTFDPRRFVDPFGTVILPGLILILIASGTALLPLFAYAKPMPRDSTLLKRKERDSTLVALAGPAANLLIAAAAGLLLRLGPSGDLFLLGYAFLWANLFLFVINLMPIPGLDGAEILARFLPARAREVYTNLNQYLPLFILAIFFLFGGPLLPIVHSLAGGVCRVLAGASCG